MPVRAPSLPVAPPSVPVAPPNVPAGGVRSVNGSTGSGGSSGSSGSSGPSSTGGSSGSAAGPVPAGSGSAARAGGGTAASAGSGARVGAPGWPVVGAGRLHAGAATGARLGAASPWRREGRRRRAYERRLRRTVARLAGCLYGVSPLDRRVLVLRVGPGHAPALSRASVARTLDLSPRRVHRSERRGLRDLRATNRFEGCGPIGRASGSELVATVPIAAAARSAFLAAIHATAAQEPVGGRKRRSDSRGRVLGARAGPPSETESAGAALFGHLENGGHRPVLLAALLAALIALAVLALRLRRDQHPSVTAGPSRRTSGEAGPASTRREGAAARGERDPRDWEPPPPPWSPS
jgi:hypothetical protein